jgi:hypothetical protein
MQTVPLKPIKNQTTQIVLGGQSCVVHVYQTDYGLFLELSVNDEPVIAGVICQNRNRIVRSAYLGFSGDLAFDDTQGTADPVYTGLGSRFLLLYFPASELAGPVDGFHEARARLLGSARARVVRRERVRHRRGAGRAVGERADRSKVGSPAYNSADVQIAGLPLAIMNQLSRVGLQAAAVRNNIITVRAGNEEEGTLPTVFRGVIQEAWPDFSNPTEAVFCINANTGLLAAMKPAAPTSYTGSTDVATIMGTLARQMGYTLENNGVTIQLSNPYLAGSARDQALSVAEAAGIYVYFEDDGGVMAICPKDASRGGFAPVISRRPTWRVIRPTSVRA